MTRDYSRFLGASAGATGPSPLQLLGWQGFFSAQVDAEELAAHPPVRVVEVHRSGLRAVGDGIDTVVPPGPEATVGDWLMLDRDLPTSSRVLERKSLFWRPAAGRAREVQLIAANVDTVFVVSSCNADFNVARLERYLALAFEAGVEPVIVLTKADLAADVSGYEAEAGAISEKVPVVVLNAKGGGVRDALSGWLGRGRTVAFLGMSGVGKSTLVNALLGSEAMGTGAIREDDARGRHTTTSRQLLFLEDGTGVLDTPGMREIQLAEVEAGISELFGDIEDLAAGCRFRDCSHEVEPGCAVRAAVEAGELDAGRLARWKKLAAEERHNTESLAERRSREKKFGKMVKSVVREKRER